MFHFRIKKLEKIFLKFILPKLLSQTMYCCKILKEGTEIFLGAEILFFCREATLAALQENIESCEVHRRHFDLAFMAVKPRTSRELIEPYKRYENESGIHSI